MTKSKWTSKIQQWFWYSTPIRTLRIWDEPDKKPKPKYKLLIFLITAVYWQLDAISGQLPEPLDPLPVSDNLPTLGAIPRPKNATRGKHNLINLQKIDIPSMAKIVSSSNICLTKHIFCHIEDQTKISKITTI